MSINRKRKLNNAELPNFYTPVIKKQKLSSNENSFFYLFKNEIQIINARLQFIEKKVNNISNHIIKMEEKLDKIVDKFDNKGFIEFIENIENMNITEKEISKKFPEPCWYKKVNNISNHIIKMEEKLDKIVDKFDNKAFIEFIENIQNLNITEKEIPKKFPELCWYIS
tara:strand:+ start:4420 stop:4923 length:504 start_codon:yes stop_codon:yes gene_type:complete